MTHVAIELPEDIASRLGEPGDLSRVVLEALAAQGYRSDKLAHAEVQKVLDYTSRGETDSYINAL